MRVGDLRYGDGERGFLRIELHQLKLVASAPSLSLDFKVRPQPRAGLVEAERNRAFIPRRDLDPIGTNFKSQLRPATIRRDGVETIQRLAPAHVQQDRISERISIGLCCEARRLPDGV